MEIDFILLDELVTVETNDCGTLLRVTFGDALIKESSGDCFRYPDTLLLSGAAREAVWKKALRKAGEASIRDFILNTETDYP